MFHRIKKAFTRPAKPRQEREPSVSRLTHGPVSEWASTQGFAFSVDGSGNGIALEGKVSGRPWRIQVGRPTRNYIRGQEVRARAELGLENGLTVIVMNRPLHDALAKKAYDIYTDPLQTSVNLKLPEEMGWLPLYDQVAWEGLPTPFWERYNVLTDCKENAISWIDPRLAQSMLDWPFPGWSPEVPFMLFLMRGRAYLRMEYTPAGLSTLRHAALIFTSACAAALERVREP